MNIYISENTSVWSLLFLSALACAGTAVLWRNILENHPSLKNILKHRLGFFNKVLLCGSCFTYWLSLALVLICDPLAGLNVISESELLSWLTHTLFSWMVLAMLSISNRFGYVFLQEQVASLVHGEHNHR